MKLDEKELKSVKTLEQKKERRIQMLEKERYFFSDFYTF